MTARQVLDRIAGPLVLLVALLIALMYWQGRHVDAQNAARDRAAAERIAAVVDCQARFNAVVVELVQVRDALRGHRDFTAEVVFQRIGEIVEAAQVDKQDLSSEFARFKVAFAAYDAAIKRLDAYKKANPLPPFPDCQDPAVRVATAAPTPTPTLTP